MSTKTNIMLVNSADKVSGYKGIYDKNDNMWWDLDVYLVTLGNIDYHCKHVGFEGQTSVSVWSYYVIDGMFF